MSVFKNGTIWWYSITIDGTRQKISTKEKNKKRAELIEQDARRRARESGLSPALVAQLRNEVPTVAAFAPEFLLWVEKSNELRFKTREYYTNGVRHILASPLAAMRMNVITKAACETAAFPSLSIARCAICTLRVLLGKAKEASKITEAPKLTVPKLPRRLTMMTWQQAERIAAEMGKCDAADALFVLRSTGMRPSEAFSMRWEQISWDDGPRGTYQITESKTDDGIRRVPLLDRSLDVLRRRHLEQGKPGLGWVFPTKSKEGHLLSIKSAFLTARKAAGIPEEVCLYTARHAAITELHAALPTALAMEISGHRDFESARPYQHHDASQAQLLIDRHRASLEVPATAERLAEAQPATKSVQ
jgi:integrase